MRQVFSLDGDLQNSAPLEEPEVIEFVMKNCQTQ